jgi:hypothetical protein
MGLFSMTNSPGFSAVQAKIWDAKNFAPLEWMCSPAVRIDGVLLLYLRRRLLSRVRCQLEMVFLRGGM